MQQWRFAVQVQVLRVQRDDKACLLMETRCVRWDANGDERRRSWERRHICSFGERTRSDQLHSTTPISRQYRDHSARMRVYIEAMIMGMERKIRTLVGEKAVCFERRPPSWQ